MENIDHQNKSYRIKWNEQELLSIKGAICTEEQFLNFEESIAHIFENGEILQHGKEIGTVEEIEFLEEY